MFSRAGTFTTIGNQYTTVVVHVNILQTAMIIVETDLPRSYGFKLTTSRKHYTVVRFGSGPYAA